MDWSSAFCYFSQSYHFQALGYFFSQPWLQLYRTRDTTSHALPLTLTRACPQGFLEAHPGILCLPSELSRCSMFAQEWHQAQANKLCHSADLKIWSTLVWQELQCDFQVRSSSQVIGLKTGRAKQTHCNHFLPCKMYVLQDSYLWYLKEMERKGETIECLWTQPLTDTCWNCW